MTSISYPYRQRRLLRSLEKGWSWLEATVNRITSEQYNPLYHLGTLGIFLLIVITLSGIYLTIFYRPGTERAYASVEAISSTMLGSLMRSVHRYASDALLLVALLHGLKTFLSDRFWGSRWLAWVSGWVLVALSWLIGTTGYWLVWDIRAQWLTEYLIDSARSAVALTFLGTNVAAATFVIFVIVLFLHIFLPLAILLLIIVHVLRLMRARVWSPRWVMLLSLVALVLISLWKPTASAAEADLDVLIQSVGLDLWYMSFLPVLDRLGIGFWLAFSVVLIGLSSLAWLLKDKDVGPAIVMEANCTGCALCSVECPYRAIEMHHRDAETSEFLSLAVINEGLCTGCGLCIGACAPGAIFLEGIFPEKIYDLEEAPKANSQPIVAFACARQAALGTLERLEFGNGSGSNVVLSVLPCVGMVDVDWVKEIVEDGAESVAVVGCPYDDCNYREGPRWTGLRLQRRRASMLPKVRWIEAAPGDPRPLDRSLEHPIHDLGSPELLDDRARQRSFPRLPVAGVALLLLSLVFALSLPIEIRAGTFGAEASELRVIVEHPGKVSDSLETGGIVLPEGATVGAEQILGGERFPVLVRITLDGKVVAEETFKPRGLRGEGEINGLSSLALDPGTYQLKIEMQDDGGDRRTVYDDQVEVGAGRARSLIYDQLQDAFELR